ncbi:MAG: NADP-dependent malic enzyme [Deltaproteobacteria bacterium]|nr:MAG: NADP-dependent malic enzyme [Deltaproteobacteria bacterium]
MKTIRREDALAYHVEGRPGKIEVVPTKPVATQRDLSLAYSPGVAEPCREIARDPLTVDLYTARSNLVAVVTNGTAVLGLGNIGPLAAKPVMEGKAVLFKRYADIDVFDIEIAETDPEKLIEVVAALEPTFGGINLEDIRAPDCFVVERALRERMKIPVFHDDQHGTAIISSAALINAAEVQGKKLEDLSVVCIGAGAAAISCMGLWMRFGVKQENIVLIDSRGVVRQDREGPIEEFRAAFAVPASDPRHTLEEAFDGVDVMCGLASGGLVSPEMVKKMAPKPIIFALANPDPEISYEAAREARPDAIIGTGRSDYPNQVNNVLGFPYIFRGALDVGATVINEGMKQAAAGAWGQLAREGVPEAVMSAYGGSAIRFGPDYVIPKPMDERALYWVAPAVAQAAIETGVATRPIDMAEYRHALTTKLSPARRVMNQITEVARSDMKRIVFPEGENERIIQAARIAVDDEIAHPVLIARQDRIDEIAQRIGITLDGIEIVPRDQLPKVSEYADLLFKRRQRHGMTAATAERLIQARRTVYGMMMVATGDADGLISGMSSNYRETIRPALQIIGTRGGRGHAAGLYIVITKDDVKFLADTTINIDPSAETMAETAVLAAELVEELGIKPRVAMLSFSNFGDAKHESSAKAAAATARVREMRPDLMVDGEMQADVALIPALREPYPFSTLEGAANVLIFPNLDSGNIAYKLLAATGGGEVIGPLVLGMKRSVNALQQGATVQSVLHMIAITGARAMRLERAGLEEIV